MPSFFDKLKKGMNIESGFEEPEEETTSAASKKQNPVAEKKQAEVKKANKKEKSEEKKKELGFVVKQEKKSKKLEMIQETEEMPVTGITTEIEIQDEPKEILKAEGVQSVVGAKSPEVIKSVEKIIMKQKETWPETEGELVVDVYQTENELVVQSAVAGIKPEDLDIDIEKDILVIKGSRKNDANEKRDYFFQECFYHYQF